MASIGDMVAYLRLDSKGFTKGAVDASRSTRQLNNRFSMMARSAGKAGAAMAGVGGGVAIASNAIQRTLSFDREMAKSLAIQETTIDQQQRMREEAMRVAGQSQFSTSEVAQAYRFLASAGLNAEQQLQSIGLMAEFAQAGQFDMALATDLLTDSQSALGLASKDSAQHFKNMQLVADSLTRAQTLANASTQQFSESLTNGAAVAASQAGMDIAETLSVLAIFADKGIKGAEAGTQFGIVLRDLQSKAISNAEAFKKANIEIFRDGSFVGITEAVEQLSEKLADLDAESQKRTLLQLGFTDKSVKALQTLLGTTDQMQQFRTELQNVDGVTSQIAKQTLVELDETMNRLGESFDRVTNNTIKPAIDNVLVPALDLISDVGTGWHQLLADMDLVAQPESMDLSPTLKSIMGYDASEPVIESPVEQNADRARADSIRRLGPAQLPGFTLGGDGASLPTPENSVSQTDAATTELKKQTALLERLLEDTATV